MKIEIEITEQRKGYTDENSTVVKATINNGHWKYWDWDMKTNEPISLTLNNICEARWLNKPVKDAYGFFDRKEWEENHKIIINNATVRTYETLLGYLNFKINNAKEDYKRSLKYRILDNKTEHIFYCVGFEEQFKKTCDDTVTADIVYEKEDLLTVKITIVE